MAHIYCHSEKYNRQKLRCIMNVFLLLLLLLLLWLLLWLLLLFCCCCCCCCSIFRVTTRVVGELMWSNDRTWFQPSPSAQTRKSYFWIWYLNLNNIYSHPALGARRVKRRAHLRGCSNSSPTSSSLNPRTNFHPSYVAISTPATPRDSKNTLSRNTQHIYAHHDTYIPDLMFSQT